MAENFFGLTDTGKLRDNNEDALIAEKLPSGLLAACVIDGVGGYEGGEVAAGIAKDTLIQNLHTANTDILQVMRNAFLQANKNIYDAKTKGNDQMACVLTAAVIDVQTNQLYYAHVGDTRMYLLRDGSLVKVTKDQSFVGFLEDSGRLSEAEAMAHPKRNEINKALGFDPQIELQSDYIETGSSPFLPGDMLLLCSDGLTDLVRHKEMTAILSASNSLQQKAQALINAANNAGGKDNITVVLVRNDKKPQKQKATKPVLVKKIPPKETAAPESPIDNAVTPSINREQRKSGTAIWVVAAVALLLALTTGWLWMKNRDLQAAIPKPEVITPMNAAEKRLNDSVVLASRRLTLAGVKSGVIELTDTLFIRQDSLHIDGNSLVLQPDSAFHGPAIFVTANCKYLLLENITFQNFKTAIVTQAKGTGFKNVVFQNCSLPVLQEVALQLKSDTLNGKLTDSAAFKKSSLP